MHLYMHLSIYALFEFNSTSFDFSIQFNFKKGKLRSRITKAEKMQKIAQSKYKSGNDAKNCALELRKRK